MEQRFIQNVTIQWDKIEYGSYLRNIPALQFENSLSFRKNITFFVGENGTGKSTLLEAIASHSPILLGIPDAQILSFDDGVIHECDYTETESYQVTEMFINSREYLLKRLLDD